MPGLSSHFPKILCLFVSLCFPPNTSLSRRILSVPTILPELLPTSSNTSLLCDTQIPWSFLLFLWSSHNTILPKHICHDYTDLQRSFPSQNASTIRVKIQREGKQRETGRLTTVTSVRTMCAHCSLMLSLTTFLMEFSTSLSVLCLYPFGKISVLNNHF